MVHQQDDQLHITGVTEGGEREEQKVFQRNNDRKLLKSWEENWHPDPRCPNYTKKDESKEICIKAHYNQISKSQRQRQNFERSKRNTSLYGSPINISVDF